MSKKAAGHVKLLPWLALIWDIAQAANHKRNCPRCLDRDYLAIALDITHLANLT